MIPIREIDVRMTRLAIHDLRTRSPPRFAVTSQILLADVCLSLHDQPDKFLPVENPHQPRADEFAGDGQCGAVIE